MSAWKDRSRNLAKQDEKLAQWRAKQTREAVVFKAEEKKWDTIEQTIRDSSLCLCDVEDSEIPCWQHHPVALQVLWVASGGEGPLVAPSSGGRRTFSPFFNAYGQRAKFLKALGLPARIDYKPDARGYRLYENNNTSGRPKALGKDLPAAIQRYRTNIAAQEDPNKPMVEKTYRLFKTELEAHQDAVDQVMAKVQAGKSSSRTLSWEAFTWAWEVSAPHGTKGNDQTVVLSVVLVATHKGSSWRSSQLPDVPERARSWWHHRTCKQEQRAYFKANPRKRRRYR